jgi:hypothetical protein
MNKDRAKEILEKLRGETSEYVIKKITDKPINAGQYNVQIEGVRTIAPLFLKFDGENWVGLEEIANLGGGDINKVSYYDKKITMETTILKKCGWDNKQLGFYGTMVHNISKEDGSPIADIVSSRNSEQVSVEWFVPNQEGDKIALVYSVKENKIIEDKTDSGIRNEKDLNAFLDNIHNTINETKGDFFPKAKITEENKNKLSI